MVKIRLARAGQKKRPYFHVVATDSRSSRDGKFIERLGYFNPSARGQEVKCNIDTAKVEAWVKTGAQVSERVAFLVKSLPAKTAETAAA